MSAATRDVLASAISDRLGVIQRQILQMLEDGSDAQEVGKLLKEKGDTIYRVTRYLRGPLGFFALND